MDGWHGASPRNARSEWWWVGGSSARTDGDAPRQAPSINLDHHGKKDASLKLPDMAYTTYENMNFWMIIAKNNIFSESCVK